MSWSFPRGKAANLWDYFMVLLWWGKKLEWDTGRHPQSCTDNQRIPKIWMDLELRLGGSEFAPIISNSLHTLIWMTSLMNTGWVEWGKNQNQNLGIPPFTDMKAGEPTKTPKKRVCQHVRGSKREMYLKF